MATKQITVERFSVVSAKPVAEVVRAIETQVGHPEIATFTWVQNEIAHLHGIWPTESSNIRDGITQST